MVSALCNSAELLMKMFLHNLLVLFLTFESLFTLFLHLISRVEFDLELYLPINL